ncbi:MAG: 3-isopropylmalate dehydratase large subunit [Anaerolineales bacterium]|nr:3-isopropylmalate dehydratase large subunit [Anaerolineales bacterium]
MARKAGKTGARAGDILEVRPDRILTHDNTAAIAQIFYKELGAERVQDPSRLLIVLDHASPPPTPTHAQIHAEARAFVRAQGVRDFFDIGRGICHQVAAEEALLLPGQVILGADSHTTHHGWMGAFGAGVGRSEAAALWATGGLWLRVPHSVRFTLQGSLASGVTTKDLCLAIIGELGADGGLYLSAEFDGPGLRTLSIDSRMVIPNMMAEFGVKNACLAPDEAVFEYLASRGSGRASRADCEASALWADPGAEYLAEYEIDLSAVGPLAAAPHGVDRRQTLSEAAGKPIDMAFLGTCTNGRLEDLRAAAQAVAGKKVRPGTRFLVVPASVEVYRAAVAEGIIGALVDSGAMIGVPGCGPCMGNHLGIPAAGEVVFSTANRNFKGRMGQPDAEIHLGSPALVALGAVLGRIPSPREFEDIPHPASPSSSIPALREGKRRAKAREGMRADSFLRLVRGTDLRKFGPQSPSPSPSIPPLREGRRWEKGSEGMRADAFVADGSAWVYGGDINTDRIFPGKYTYTLRTPEEIAAHALEDLDPEFLRASKPGDVIFAGRNMGCGSSREQAVTCLTGRGVRAVVAESFGRIFYRNAINRGLPAIVCPEAVAAAHRGDPVKVDLERGEILLPAGRFAYPPFPESVRALLAAGGLIRYLKTKGK